MLNEMRPGENINKRIFEAVLEINLVRKQVPSSRKLQDHAYE